MNRLDAHSPCEKDHAERVAAYAVATGEALGLSDPDLLNLRYSALLHDVGKISVDARLLRKIGRLSDEEMAALRLHALLAMSMLEAFDWLKPSLPAIRSHHERWDGGGYPDGLSAEAIPIGARIINVAETFDVLANGLALGAKGEEAALEEIRNCSGAQFDPRVVEAFLNVQPLIQPVAG